MSFAPKRVTQNMMVSPFAPKRGPVAQKKRRGMAMAIGRTRARGPMDWDARGQTIERQDGTHDSDTVL